MHSCYHMLAGIFMNDERPDPKVLGVEIAGVPRTMDFMASGAQLLAWQLQVKGGGDGGGALLSRRQQNDK